MRVKRVFNVIFPISIELHVRQLKQSTVHYDVYVVVFKCASYSI